MLRALDGVTKGDLNRVRSLRHQILSRFYGKELESRYLRQVIDQATVARDVTLLMSLKSNLSSVIRRSSRIERTELVQQVLNAMTVAEVPESEKLRKRFADEIKKLLPGYVEPSFSVASGEGPWQLYRARPLKIVATDPENYALEAVYHDRRSETIERGGELILIWRRKFSHFGLERLNLSTKERSAIGPPIAGGHVSFRHLPVAVSSDAVFVASRTPGFTMVRNGVAEVFTQKHGAPSDVVYSMAWHKDRLFIGFVDSIASFDPKTKTFQLIASATSINPRNPIDGKGGFFPRTLFADEQHQCLWLNIQDNASGGRQGCWRYDIDSRSFKHIAVGLFQASQTDTGVLLNCGMAIPDRLVHVDSKNGQSDPMAAYARTHDNTPTYAHDLIMVGDHVVSNHGALYTNDGQAFRVDTGLRWDWFQPVKNGFITHYDASEKTLWSVERLKDSEQ